jgi:Icc protein
VLVQLSDAHLSLSDPASLRAFSRTLDALERLRPRPEAIIFSGDLTDSGSAQEYRWLVSLIGRLRAAMDHRGWKPRQPR